MLWKIKRVWNKVDSYYVEDGNTISIGDILLDNEGDLLYFNNINQEESMLYAKSNPVETLREHTDELLKQMNVLRESYGKI